MKSSVLLALILISSCKQNPKAAADSSVEVQKTQTTWIRGHIPTDLWAHRFVIRQDGDKYNIWVEQSDEDREKWFSWEEAKIIESNNNRVLFSSPWGVIGKAFDGGFELVFEDESHSKAKLKILNTNPQLEAEVTFESWSKKQQESQSNIFYLQPLEQQDKANKSQ